MMQAFTIARLPCIRFGSGVIRELPGLIRQYGKQVLLVTGKASFRATPHWPELLRALNDNGIAHRELTVSGEPSPELVDDAVRSLKREAIDVVVGIGGGSVLDAAKAIAGLLKPGNSVMDHLEGVGPELPYTGPATPFIAAPTTAGTGSEATKNAVLSRIGPDGFKKSFRDDRLVAEWAVIDPELLAGCPPELIAADGMDALTQLMESYTSLRSNPMTEALALAGVRQLRDGLERVYAAGDDEETAEAREEMAHASLLSGITLAQTGLGSVHGLASPLGAFFPIPHGVVCGTLLAEATRINIMAMAQREPDNVALSKYAQLGRLFAGAVGDDHVVRVALVDKLTAWQRHFDLRTLDAYGVSEKDLPRIVANSRGSSMKTNPIVLGDDEIREILRRRLAA